MANSFTKFFLSAGVIILIGSAVTFGQEDYDGANKYSNGSEAQIPEPNFLVKHHEKIARQYFEEVWNKGKLGLLDGLLGENYTIEKPQPGLESPSAESKKSYISGFMQAFPDAHFKIRELKATEDSVLVRIEITGTHRGAFQGIEPTGKRIKIDQMQMKRFNKGKIVFHTQILDDQQLVAQLIEK